MAKTKRLPATVAAKVRMVAVVMLMVTLMVMPLIRSNASVDDGIEAQYCASTPGIKCADTNTNQHHPLTDWTTHCCFVDCDWRRSPLPRTVSRKVTMTDFEAAVRCTCATVSDRVGHRISSPLPLSIPLNRRTPVQTRRRTCTWRLLTSSGRWVPPPPSPSP